MQGAGENYAHNKLLMMSQWCLVKRHCFPSDPFVSVPCSPFNETQKKAAEQLCAIFPFFSLPLLFFLRSLLHPPPPLRLSFAVNLCLRLCFSIPSHPLPLRGPDLAHENMLEWACSAGKGLLMQTPLGSIHWTSSTYHRCDSFHLTVNFS